MWTRYISLPPTLHQWEHSHMDTPGSRASWIVYTLSLWKQRGADSGRERWSHLPHIPAEPLLPVPSSHSQAVHIPHILQSTASWNLQNVLLSLSSKFWLLSVYNRLFSDLFIYKRLWTTYVPPGIVLDAGHVCNGSIISNTQSWKLPPAQESALPKLYG